MPDHVICCLPGSEELPACPGHDTWSEESWNQGSGPHLVWSVPNTVQGWVKSECGNAQQLRNEVKHHIEETMDKTRGL
ncbi:hypothetical protein BaRGS_00001690, partial [Batillaria attramentaria]